MISERNPYAVAIYPWFTGQNLDTSDVARVVSSA